METLEWHIYQTKNDNTFGQKNDVVAYGGLNVARPQSVEFHNHIVLDGGTKHGVACNPSFCRKKIVHVISCVVWAIVSIQHSTFNLKNVLILWDGGSTIYVHALEVDVVFMKHSPLFLVISCLHGLHQRLAADTVHAWFDISHYFIVPVIMGS
jgi:hypothetical protein